jgi:type I restriction enzyme M protein
MPSGVFKPYAGVSTAILVFTKTGSGGTDKVWFYDMLADGKSLDDKRTLLVDEEIFNTFLFSADLTELENEKIHSNFNLPDIIKRYPNRHTDNRPRTEQSFLVPFSEIKANDWDLSINKYKEIVYEEVKYDKPQVILERIEKLDEERIKIQKNLKSLI